MRIGKLLTQKGDFVATVAPESTVWEALASLDEHKIGALVVSADGRTPEGIVSERDIVRRLNDQGASVLDGPVSSIMVRDLFCASPDDELESLMSEMTTRRIRHVPVLRDGELVGIVSIGDVVKNRLEALQEDNKALVDYIHAR